MEGWAKLIYSANNFDCLYSLLTLNWQEGSRRLRDRCFHSMLGSGLLDDVGPLDLMQPMWLVMLPMISTDKLDVVDVIQGQVKNYRFSRLLALYSEDWKWWCQQQVGQMEGTMQDETTTQSMEAVPRWPLNVRRFEKSTWRLDEKSDTGYMEGWAKLIYSANNFDCLYSFPDIELTRGVKTTEEQMLPFIAGVGTLGRCWTFGLDAAHVTCDASTDFNRPTGCGRCHSRSGKE